MTITVGNFSVFVFTGRRGRKTNKWWKEDRRRGKKRRGRGKGGGGGEDGMFGLLPLPKMYAKCKSHKMF